MSGKTEHLAIERKEDGMTLIQWDSNGETALVPTSSLVRNSDMGRRGRRVRGSRRGGPSASASSSSSSTKPNTKKRVVERDGQNSNRKGKRIKTTATAASSSPATTPTTSKKQRAPPPRSSSSSSNKERGLPTSIKPKKKNTGKSTGDSIDGDIKAPTKPDTVHSSISISAAAAAAAVAPPPDPVSSSAAAATAPTTVSATKPRASRAPVAFVEKDFVVKQDSEEKEREQGGKEVRVAVPETISSGDDIKHEQAWAADKDSTNNNRKRRKQGSKVSIKAEELENNNHDPYSIKRTRRGKRNQCSSEENTTASSNDNDYANTTKNRQVGGRNATNNVAPKKPRSLGNKHPQEEDNTEEEEISNCCQFCNDPDWEKRIYYKCGTVLSKYFPKSYNNPNPGWYRGTIIMHHLSSDSYDSANCDSDYDYECMEEGDSGSEGKNTQQSIIYNEIHYEDGDTENITQDDLKVQLMDGSRGVKILYSTEMATTSDSDSEYEYEEEADYSSEGRKEQRPSMDGGREVKILHSTKMATTSNSECRHNVDNIPTPTLSNNDKKWLEKYRRLQQFKEESGHCRVPIKTGSDPSLGKWVQGQRQYYKKGTLAPDRAKKLNDIGFQWVVVAQTPDQLWLEKFGRLKNFRDKNGHCRVQSNFVADPSLYNWVVMQRACYNRGNLARNREQKLREIGFVWGDASAETYDQNWIETFERLKQFKAKNGHCRVPSRYGSDPPLGRWVCQQREQHKRGKLATDREEKLDNIGFDWGIREAWQENCNRLKIFKADNGHCCVPDNYGPDPSLGNWVSRQRTFYKKGKLAPDRVKKLNKIGFEWYLNQTWEEMFVRLEQFKTEKGHCRVPRIFDPDPALGRWVGHQREAYKSGNLAPDRVEKLEDIDFEWDILNQTWDDMFVRLEQFKTQKGHCRVPKIFDPDPALGNWVGTQRKQYKKGKMAKNRIEKLENIGFEWVIQCQRGN